MIGGRAGAGAAVTLTRRRERVWHEQQPARRSWVPAGITALAGMVVLTAMATRAAAPGRDTPAGGIELAAGATGSALFAVDGLVPGRQVARCVVVRVHDAVPGSTARLHAVIRSGDLAPYLATTVRTGHGGGPDCAGFVPTGSAFTGRLTELAAARLRSPAGLPVVRVPEPDSSVTFQLTFAVADTDAAQGRTTRFDLVWSAPDAAGSGGVSSERPGVGVAGPESWPRRLLHGVLRFVGAVGLPVLKAVAAGLLTIPLVIAFLLVQDWIDRRDPKLVLAPVRPPAQLGFADRNEAT